MAELDQYLRLKHVLLDTCFIAKAYQYSDTEYFDNLFNIFKEYACVPITNEYIRFEFLRGCRTRDQIESKKSFIEQLSGASLPNTPDILEEAASISNVYSNKGVPTDGIGPIDCYLSSFLKKYNRDLVLVTLNHKDFPLLLHKRFHIHSIDTDKEILTIGFYSFKEIDYHKHLADIR